MEEEFQLALEELRKTQQKTAEVSQKYAHLETILKSLQPVFNDSKSTISLAGITSQENISEKKRFGSRSLMTIPKQPVASKPKVNDDVTHLVQERIKQHNMIKKSIGIYQNKVGLARKKFLNNLENMI